MTEQMSDELALVWDDLIWKVVRFVAWDFPDIDREEIYQDLWEFALTHRQLDPEREGITTMLQRQAKKGAWNQRKEHLHQSSQYSYRTTDVKKILETAFFYTDWHDGFVPEDAISADNMAAYDIRADITQAVQRLKTPQYRAAILRRFRDGIEDPVGSAGRKTLNRAVQRLTDTLNWYYPMNQATGHPGKRKAISNATAGYMIENQENR